MALSFSSLNPVAFSLGPFTVHWYALSYVVGIILSCAYAKKLQKHFSNGLTPDIIDKFSYGAAIIGVIVGGRLGHVIFYEPLYYAHHPLEIFMTWKGGMSFHGGFLGFLGGALWFCRKHEKAFFQLMDAAAVSVPLAIGLGRIANFINGELYGMVTDQPWGVIFPKGGPFPRHPTQLYEAFFEGFFLWMILFFLWRYRFTPITSQGNQASSMSKETQTSQTSEPDHIAPDDTPFVSTAPTLLDGTPSPSPLTSAHGFFSGFFMLFYGASRFCIEYIKDPFAQGGQTFLPFTNGQLLCIPMILLGLYFCYTKRK